MWQGKLVVYSAKTLLFICTRQLLLHCFTLCIHAVVNQKFLTP
ncbi:hypothetical protein PALB_15450 [Pseudoalteromonas luteoviolacea B = ATCC 29581]|nr:hypothetical protein PALB_15450 [Pseudoalteromonas luteoviolacea B = ATCC 29581]